MFNPIDTQTTADTIIPPNPLMAIMFFFIVTSIYCVISIFLTDSTQRLTAKVCYILFVICGEYFINLNLSESMCGLRQWKSTFFITIVPWLLIFILMHLFIGMFPGWLSPFSNTFGYLVVKLMGLPELMNKILVEKLDDSEASRALESVRSDSSLFINELYAESGSTGKDKNNVPDGRTIRNKFDKAWDKMVTGKIIRDFPDVNPTDSGSKTAMKNNLYNFVQMKFTIGEYIWNLLTGSLVTSISYNYIINTGCAKSPKEMKNRYDQYEADETQRQKERHEQNAKQPTYTQN